LYARARPHTIGSSLFGAGWLGQDVSYCPHLDPIERLWGLMHRHTTHNKCYAGFKGFQSRGADFSAR
jgi:hypothetical protein